MNLIFASVLASAPLSAPAGAALVNGDSLQTDLSNAVALIAGTSTSGLLRPDWSRYFSREASLPGELDRFLLRDEDGLGHEISSKLRQNARVPIFQTGDSVLQTFSLGTADVLALKVTDDAKASGFGRPQGALTNVKVAAVPEPVPLTFIGIGALALMGIQALRRRRG
ncbi:MAG TPA: hypothetical protein VGD78_20975 [Chthoniobacterales bacterium]